MNDRRKNEKSKFTSYCLGTVAILLVGCACFVFLYFQTDIIMDVDTSVAHKVVDFERTTVTTYLQAPDNEGSGGTPGLGGGGNAPGIVPNPQPQPTPPPVTGDELVFTSGGNFECPYTDFCYSYMGWQMVTSTSSAQYAWRLKHFPSWVNDKNGPGDPTAFDSEGFGRVEGRYVIAVSSYADGGIGEVGQALDVYIDTDSDGKEDLTLPCVVGDIKSAGDATWTQWGHTKGSSINVIEFVVDKQTWYYPTYHVNPGNTSCHPEWKGKVIKIIKGSII